MSEEEERERKKMMMITCTGFAVFVVVCTFWRESLVANICTESTQVCVRADYILRTP